MPVTTKVEPIDRDIELILREELSPQARSATMAQFARESLSEAQSTNRRILGRVPPHRTFVDGSEGGSIDRVRPDGVIVFEFELVTDLLRFIADELRAISPVRSGRYRASHTLFADGAEVPIGATIPIADEYVFLSDVIYARKIEGMPGRPPQSKQAPRGVYQITTRKPEIRQKFGNIGRVRFEWRKPYRGRLLTGKAGNKSDGRVPAIVVTIR